MTVGTIKTAVLDFVMITEISMCEYTTYGHGGARRDGADALASLSMENLLNEQYTRYMTVFPNEVARTITGFPQPGITVKGSLRVRFAGG